MLSTSHVRSVAVPRFDITRSNCEVQTKAPLSFTSANVVTSMVVLSSGGGSLLIAILQVEHKQLSCYVIPTILLYFPSVPNARVNAIITFRSSCNRLCTRHNGIFDLTVLFEFCHVERDNNAISHNLLRVV